MKRVLLLVATLAMAVSATAQHRAMLMDESFDGTSLPEGWMADGVAQTLWMISETNYAGDAANELVFYEGNICSSRSSIAWTTMKALAAWEWPLLPMVATHGIRHGTKNMAAVETIPFVSKSKRPIWASPMSGFVFSSAEISTVSTLGISTM